MGEQEDTETAADQWGDSAEGWAKAAEAESGIQADTAVWMLKAAAVQPGEHVLELACGAGVVGLQAAELVGASGVVVCSDSAEPMVQAVRKRIADLGLSNVEAWVLDMTRLALDKSERFDVVLCRSGYMLVPDPIVALRQSAGALRSEGRLTLTVWSAAESNPWLAIVLDAVMTHFKAPPPAAGTPGPFALGNPERVSALLEGAGFVDITVESIDGEQAYESSDAWWELIREVSGPLAVLLKSLPEAHLTAIRERATKAAAEYEQAGGKLVFPAQAIGARAVKPRPEPIPAED